MVNFVSYLLLVLQRALEFANKSQLDGLIAKIGPSLFKLREIKFGPKLIFKLLELYPKLNLYFNEFGYNSVITQNKRNDKDSKLY